MANSFIRKNISEASLISKNEIVDISAAGGEPVKVRKDGVIEARGFFDSNDNLEMSADGANVSARIKLSKGVSSVLDVNSNTLTYNSTKSHLIKLKNAFFSYGFTRIFFSHAQKGKSSFLGKGIKKILSIILGAGSTFIYHFKKGGKVYAEKASSRRNVKTFKIPVQLKFANSFSSLSDLVIIKTGQFNYVGSVRSGFVSGSEKIVYISPHREYSGIAYIKDTGYFGHLGTGNLASRFSGASGIADTLIRTPYYYLSSKDYLFPTDYILSGGSSYQELNSERALVDYVAPSSLTGTSFYSLYTGLQSKILTTKWNGIIPAYTPFYIETWSTNGKEIGYEGSIEISPLAGVGFDNFEIEALGFGYSATSSRSNAENTAEHYARVGALRKIGSTLIDIGVVASGSHLRKYVKHIESQTNS